MVPIAIFHCIRNDSKLSLFFFSFVCLLLLFLLLRPRRRLCLCRAVQRWQSVSVTKLNDTFTSCNYTVFVHHFGWICHWNIRPVNDFLCCLFNARCQFVCVCCIQRRQNVICVTMKNERISWRSSLRLLLNVVCGSQVVLFFFVALWLEKMADWSATNKTFDVAHHSHCSWEQKQNRNK